ncbi:F-BOX WITH WD-40 2 [Prunus dulcis]|uniref:F-BOX WITH WD-40 2 n=1 Tax=Prunus dulcis TaxID=3755 RepID=A0A4Y1RJU6_PRUDU|nr:F-BOX WITH WD-40 2 [Prunus dulcis]
MRKEKDCYMIVFPDGRMKMGGLRNGLLGQSVGESWNGICFWMFLLCASHGTRRASILHADNLSFSQTTNVSWPCDFEFTRRFIGQQTREPRADWQVENFGGVIIGFMLKFGENTCNYTNTLQEFYGLDLSRGCVHGREALSIVKLVPNIKYLNLKGAKVNQGGLVTLLCGCKDLVMLGARGCFGFNENDDETSKLASHISTFMCKGSEFPEFICGMDNFVLLVDGYSFHLHVEETWDEMLNDLRDAFNDLGYEK